MGMNTGYLTAGRGKESDECLTPRYGVLPIVKHLRNRGYKKILCPFDKSDSMFVRVLRSEGSDEPLAQPPGRRGLRFVRLTSRTVLIFLI